MKSSMRRLIIDRMLTEKELVSFDELSAVLKVSSPTIKRDLRYMREELDAPIRYSRSKNAYYYQRTKEPVVRPKRGIKVRSRMAEPPRLTMTQWYSSDELYVLTSAYDLLGELENDRTSVLLDALAPLRSRVLDLFTVSGIGPRELMRRVRVMDNRIPFSEPPTFETVGAALCLKRRVRVCYYSLRTKETSFRELSPQRLVHYRNRWYVDAYCHETQKLKTFLIENIQSAEVLSATSKRMTLDEVSGELDAGYGLFHGRDLHVAKLHFDEAVAHYVLRETWHPKQRAETYDDGSLLLSVPYTNSTEIVGAILRWGSKVEVLEPASLREEVAREAERIAALYQERTAAGS